MIKGKLVRVAKPKQAKRISKHRAVSIRSDLLLLVV